MSVETDCIMEADVSAWPSSYYGRGKRVDLEKFFEKVQQEQKEIEQRQQEDLVRKRSQRHGNGRSGVRQVRFSPDPPTVFEYEAEYDTFDRLVSNIGQSKDIWPSHARRPPQRLDLRPIRNHQYGTPSTCTTATNLPPPTTTLSPERTPSTSSTVRSSSLSSASTTRSSSLSSTSTTGLPSTPPLSPSPCHSPHDDSSDEEEQPSPIVPLTPTNSLPFSPTTLTKKLTAVFTRRKRS
ncbi:hypothetical protein BCR42DRAFT_415236 [Absidia repens]|uniref:Uncharacterized protein n=1 Tax=Absidia repens TaxID=90262 RepID=A0A1X2IHG1_9FUNG|nr:hypothetical protein BCR42DRAFT_415236 [Absidia repens]